MTKTDSEYHQVRAAIATEGGKALLVINGGAAVALLGFLAAIWKEQGSNQLALAVLDSFLLFGLGVAAAAANFFFRYWTSVANQNGWKIRFKIYWLLEWASVLLSFFFFLAAVLLLVTGAKNVFGT